MESEEAIMENENNSNLESESNIRDRDQQQTIGDLLDNVTPYITEPQNLSTAITSQEDSDSNMSAENLNPPETEARVPSSNISNELTGENSGEQNGSYETEEPAEIASASASASEVREDSIQDYEDFIGDEISQQQGNLQSRVSENVDHDFETNETQERKDVSNSRSRDELMEVDNFSLDDVESSEQTSKMFKTSEATTDILETDQPGSSKNMNIADYWNDDIDLLGEDSKNSVCEKDSPERGEMVTDAKTSVLSSQDSAFREVSDELESSSNGQEVVNNDTGAGGKDVGGIGEALMQLAYIEPVEGYVDNTRISDKTLDDKSVERCLTPVDSRVTENVTDGKQSDEMLSLGAHLQELNKAVRTEVVNSRIDADVAGRGQVSHQTNSVCCGSDGENVTSDGAVSKVVESGYGMDDAVSSFDSNVPKSITSSDHPEQLDTVTFDTKGISEDAVEISDHDIDRSRSKKVTGLSLNDAQTLSKQVETPSNSNIIPKATETTESAKSSEAASNKDALQIVETSVVLSATESIRKDNKGQESTVSSNMDASSASRDSTPAKDTSTTESQDDVMEIAGIKTEFDDSKARELAKGSAFELKDEEPASSLSLKQDLCTGKTESGVKDKAVVGKKAKAAAVKNGVLESKVTENGLSVKNSPVSGQQMQLRKSADKSSGVAASGDDKKTPPKSKSPKSKVQTCLVCQKICKCKYNIVRNGDIKHLCDDDCFKQFRNTPSVFLKSTDSPKPIRKSKKTEPTPPVDALALYQKEVLSKQNDTYKTCAVCQLLNLNTSQSFCSWKGLDFCGESCLGKFQANLNTSCSFCHAYIPVDMRAICCIKIGNDIRPFCKQRCYNEFKKKLRLCSFCQRDVAGIPDAFTAMVGNKGKFKEFCSQACMKSLESELGDLDIVRWEKGSLKQEAITCPICKKQGLLKYTVRFQGKVSKLCSDLCISAFKYAHKINTDTCDSCAAACIAEEAQAHFVQYEGQMKRFCSDNCVSLFRKANSKVMQCGWCRTKKVNFDMIEKPEADNKFQMFCSLNCLSLYRVNQQAKPGKTATCDQCRKVEPAQYHLTMSDASVRNFCSYSCVISFQSHFAAKQLSPGSGPPFLALPPPPLQPQQPGPLTQHPQQKTPAPSVGRGRGRINTRQAAARQQSPSFPVICNVMSLAAQGGDQQPKTQPNMQSPPQVPYQAPPSQLAQPPSTPATGNMVPSADGKHQILIQAAPPKVGKNKSLQCRPTTQTKATSCKPHSETRETQTDEAPPKTVFVPVPVPVYVPMPTVMFTAPAPKLVPIPIPIPVPIFIPTTRKSTNGITKAIQEILERMPADPLEAELLMMAEAVASDRRPGDSDTDSEVDASAEDFSVPVVEDTTMRPAPREDESLMMRKREGQGEEDMIQMALRMAEEMSGPIEDLETSVEPVVVSTEAPPNQQQQHQTIQSYETQVDDDYIPPRSSQLRVTKRASRGRAPQSRVKRPRTEKSFSEDGTIQSESSMQLQSMEPPPDANYRLKFTYGVNAWRHWIMSKNAQIEKTRQATGSNRLKLFPTDILKCTTDELNYTLCTFIKEVHKPNGDPYSPDSIYYLCLGIQQYLYENGRIENIFTDIYFEKFTDCLNDILKTLRPKINSQGQMLCRIEEEHLWESKQLGAHSPFILLNTLIYFHTKHFILKTAQEHMSLSFAQILKHWKKGMPLKGQSAGGKNVALRFYCLANGKKDGLAARKNKDGVPVYEVTENFDNPLRCPVKLYEFFLSKCPESIKNRNDIFYPVPERSCVPDSPVWYSTQSIDTHTMDKMLTRVLLVREIQEAHLHAQPIYL